MGHKNSFNVELEWAKWSFGLSVGKIKQMWDIALMIGPFTFVYTRFWG